MAIVQFPGTNFHDLNLDWMLEQIKNLLTEWGETRTDWENLLADNTEFKSTLENEWADFREYIITHIDETVPAEVAAEIMRMTDDGSLLAIITADPTGEGSALSDAVSAWMNGHITQEVGYVLDDSLTEPTMAAQAKATGDAIRDLKENVFKPNIIIGVLSASIANVGGTYTLTANANERIIYFPVTSGKRYAIYRGYAMTGTRICYCQTVPEVGTVVTNYAALDGSASFGQFTAAETGYCCARVWTSTDAVTAEELLNTVFALEGEYKPSDNQEVAYLKDISTINGIYFDELTAKKEYVEAEDITERIINAIFMSAGTGHAITYAAESLMYIFKVTSGTKYTVDKGYSLSGARSAYCSELADIGSAVTDYADFSTSATYKTFTASATGYFCVMIRTTGDAATLSQVRETALIYEGDYNANLRRGHYYLKNIDKINNTNVADLENLLVEPYTTLPNYVLKNAIYRPLGALHKGYICMMTDDGTEDGETGLATYTIPLAIAKNVPFTFAVAKDSDVFQDGTYKATVLDAVANHGCSLAQHSVTSYWDTLTEKQLRDFFATEKAFFDSLNVAIRGAVIPGHRTNDIIKAVAGGLYGVVRSGYNGQDSSFNYNNSIQNYYNYWTSGDRSNVYGLSSYNCTGLDNNGNEAAVDYAKANNTILITYYHEYDLDATKKQRIEHLIDYAKAQGLTFITLGDIPSLETWAGLQS